MALKKQFAYPEHLPVLPKEALRPTAGWRELSACHPGNLKSAKDRELSDQLAWLEEETSQRVGEICDGCQVKDKCLVSALKDPHASGWRCNLFFSGGGLDAHDRRLVLAKYGIHVRKRRQYA